MPLGWKRQVDDEANVLIVRICWWDADGLSGVESWPVDPEVHDELVHNLLGLVSDESGIYQRGLDRSTTVRVNIDITGRFAEG